MRLGPGNEDAGAKNVTLPMKVSFR